jgi:D-sedoheptulose 7-phosphate isomerase
VLELMSKDIEKAAGLIARSLARGGKWMLFGNGGSAADAQHLAAEMVGRLYKLERQGLAALALTTDTSALTSLGNDYGFEEVFSRQVEALAKKGDVVLGFSTSGRSKNVIKALALAKKMGCVTIGFCGPDALLLKKHCTLCLKAPARMTSHIQEVHSMVGHIVCFLVEKELLRLGKIKKRK